MLHDASPRIRLQVAPVGETVVARPHGGFFPRRSGGGPRSRRDSFRRGGERRVPILEEMANLRNN